MVGFFLIALSQRFKAAEQRRREEEEKVEEDSEEEVEERWRRAGGETQGSGVPHRDESETQTRVG